MTKLKNRKGFTDQFKDILNLTTKQVIVLDEVEFNLYKDYRWNKLSTGQTLQFVFLRRILEILDNGQIHLLKKYRDEQKVRFKKRENEKFKTAFEVQGKRLTALNLSESQLWEYVKIKHNLLKMYKERMMSAKKLLDANLTKIQKDLDTELIYPIFSKVQLGQYLQILEQEENRNKKWKVNHEKGIFERHYEIELTETQAKLLFERDELISAKDENGQYYSSFEQAELKFKRMEIVLNKQQFEKYKPHHLKDLSYIEDRLKQSNNRHLKYLTRTKKYLDFYIKIVLPEKCKSRKRIDTLLTNYQRDAINKIRQFYFDKLDEGLKTYEIQHFRHNKNFVPNELLAYKTRNKLDRVNPNIIYLYDCKLAKDLMTQELENLLKMEYSHLESIQSKLKEFQIELYEKTGGEYGGWLMKIPIKEGEEHLTYSGLLLIDPEIKNNLRKMQ